MGDAELRDELEALRRRLEADGISIEEAGRAFERLTYQLADVSKEDDHALRAMVNDIEIIRFTRRPESQSPAVVDVLVRARPIFDRGA